jgi:hypothetical protein
MQMLTGVVAVGAERGDLREAHSCVERDRLGLVDAGLESYEVGPVSGGVSAEVVDELFAKPSASVGAPDVHPFQFCVLAPEDLHSAAARGFGSDVDDEEGDVLLQKFFHAVAVAAFGRIVGCEDLVEFLDQLSRGGAVGALGLRDGVHRRSMSSATSGRIVLLTYRHSSIH